MESLLSIDHRTMEGFELEREKLPIEYEDLVIGQIEQERSEGEIMFLTYKEFLLNRTKNSQRTLERKRKTEGTAKYDLASAFFRTYFKPDPSQAVAKHC